MPAVIKLSNLLPGMKKLHKRMTKAKTAGGVQPVSPIKNRVTGELSHFGHRRALDGAYIRELLGASGVTMGEAETCADVLQLLVDVGVGDVTVEDLLHILKMGPLRNSYRGHGM